MAPPGDDLLVERHGPVLQLEKPTIAAVNGPAVGGGFGIALLHDLVLAGESARLGPGFAPIGLAPELKLVTEVVPDERLVGRALELASRIAAMPPLGVQASKRLLRGSMTATMTDQLREEHAAHLVLFDHPDTHAAMDRLAGRLKRRSTKSPPAGGEDA